VWGNSDFPTPFSKKKKKKEMKKRKKKEKVGKKNEK
jgi:hypothetical protein